MAPAQRVGECARPGTVECARSPALAKGFVEGRRQSKSPAFARTLCFGDVSSASVIDMRLLPRVELQILDGVLDELEQLNLHEMTSIPSRVGGRLERLGVADPYGCSIAELIDRVFDLQEPVLQRLRAHSARPAPARRPRKVVDFGDRV
jgi:hypothetical protein